MNSISSDILGLSSEAAVIVRSGRIFFANAAARDFLGQDCSGKAIGAVFGPEISGAQCSSFIADTSVCGKSCILRVSHVDGDMIIFLSPSSLPSEVLNEPFLCAMRNSLMATELSSNILREKAEALQDESMLSSIAALTRSHYQMIRLTNNAAFILNSADMLSNAAARVLNISEFYADTIAALCNFIKTPKIVLDAGSDIILDADPSLMLNLLLNLISNCLLHAQGCSKISISLCGTPESVLLSVSDDGCGIEPDKIHTVFERYRYGFDLSSMGKGVGLGLSVVRRTAQMHGGTLLIESRPGWGTAVRVSFSKKLPSSAVFRSALPFHPCARDILPGLSSCLPAEFYSEKYLD